MFNAFEELFAPGRKHTHDEQKRLELSREDIGDNDPGRGPIDLASGKVVVRPPEPAAEAEGPEEAGEAGEPEEARAPEDAGEPEEDAG
ncbi:DUF6191 domain-containing protein [Streptomyces andamanensis]|uniref:DUF6191 domain-containing protein n=1 Tax=Streptomyces andamanensis TaxID=1565035 RepID=A0ABV8TIA2_9ACTN